MVAGLGKQKIILGYPWFQKHNPEINWKTGELNWRIGKPSKLKDILKKMAEAIRPKHSPQRPPSPTIEEISDEEEHLNQTQNPTGEMDETGNGQWIKWMRKKAENIPIFSFNLLNTEDLDDEDVKKSGSIPNQI